MVVGWIFFNEERFHIHSLLWCMQAVTLEMEEDLMLKPLTERFHQGSSLEGMLPDIIAAPTRW